MARFILSFMVLGVLPCWLYDGSACAAEKGMKQPVFLLCPHEEKSSAWSLYLLVDENDHHKVSSLGLEKLKKQNSKDSSYEAVLAAQDNPKIERETIAELDAKDFGAKQLKVEKDNALQVALTPNADGSFDLMVSLRVSMDGRFVIGGKEQAKRKVALSYDEDRKAWQAQVKTLTDDKGKPVADAAGRTMTGIVFPVTGTGIYVVLGVFADGEVASLMDRQE